MQDIYQELNYLKQDIKPSVIENTCMQKTLKLFNMKEKFLYLYIIKAESKEDTAFALKY